MGRWSIQSDSVRVFGVIQSISGATITILDNGATERDVVSAARTVIIDADSELSLGDLNIGDRIGVTGTLNDEVLTAQVIEVFTF